MISISVRLGSTVWKLGEAARSGAMTMPGDDAQINQACLSETGAVIAPGRAASPCFQTVLSILGILIDWQRVLWTFPAR